MAIRKPIAWPMTEAKIRFFIFIQCLIGVVFFKVFPGLMGMGNYRWLRCEMTQLGSPEVLGRRPVASLGIGMEGGCLKYWCYSQVCGYSFLSYTQDIWNHMLCSKNGHEIFLLCCIIQIMEFNFLRQEDRLFDEAIGLSKSVNIKIKYKFFFIKRLWI